MDQRWTPQKIAKYIDHTLLKAEASREEILRLCAEAREHNFFSVCVNSRWIELVNAELKGSSVLPIAVVGFPLGACVTSSKAFEAELCVERGAREIDMVIDLGALKSKEWNQVEKDIYSVMQASRPYPVKVILETVLLNDDEITEACRLSQRAGAAFVKTSTGFSKGGATAAHVALMRRCVGAQFGVKASGGISNFKLFTEMVEAGANRVGSSKSVEILREAAQVQEK
jgi:deoxyribose-phosphate aldolase